MYKLTRSQFSFQQAQFNLEGSNVRLHFCHENVFALQLHVEDVQVRRDVRE